MQKNSVNKVILIGNLGQDPESRFTPQGTAVTSCSVATNESWKSQSGEIKEHTEWHNIVAWDKLAEFAQQYLYKGQLVSVEGRIHTRQWKNKEGKKGKTTEIICLNLVPLEWKQKENE